MREFNWVGWKLLQGSGFDWFSSFCKRGVNLLKKLIENAELICMLLLARRLYHSIWLFDLWAVHWILLQGLAILREHFGILWRFWSSICLFHYWVCNRLCIVDLVTVVVLLWKLHPSLLVCSTSWFVSSNITLMSFCFIHFPSPAQAECKVTVAFGSYISSWKPCWL